MFWATRSSICSFARTPHSPHSLRSRAPLRSPPQREVLFAYFTFSLSPPLPSTRDSRCLFDNEHNEHCPPQRQVLFACFTFPLSPPPPSTKGSPCLVDNELNEHCPPQREVIFAYFTFFNSPAPPSTRGSL